METNKSENKPNEPIHRPFFPTFFHGTKADLKIGDLIKIGINSNYGKRVKRNIFISLPHLMLLFGGAELALRQ